MTRHLREHAPPLIAMPEITQQAYLILINFQNSDSSSFNQSLFNTSTRNYYYSYFHHHRLIAYYIPTLLTSTKSITHKG